MLTTLLGIAVEVEKRKFEIPYVDFNLLSKNLMQREELNLQPLDDETNERPLLFFA